MNDKFSSIQSNCLIASCRECGLKATHLSSTGTYRDQYKVEEDGSYDKKTNTFICWKCFRGKDDKL